MLIYLDDMLLMGHSIEEISMCRDTVIFLLQYLGFVINWKKSVLTPVQEIEFLGLKINSVNLEISLTEEKIQKVKTKCQNLLTEPETSILELTRVIGLLTSTIQAVLPARLQCRYLQLQQISSLKESHSYQQKIVLNHQSKTELLWWITNLDLCNDRSLIQPPAQVLIQTDASTKGWGATCNGISTGGMWSAQEMKYHINILELLAVKLAIQTFTKYRDVKAIHLQVDNIVALTYLMKMGGTQNLKMVELAKEIWEYLLKWGITITAEYLPSELNLTADWESRNILDSSEWMLSHQIFQKVCQIRGFPEIDLFASRLSHQIPTYVAWKPDPHSHATDAFQQNWAHKFLYAFPPFCMIPKVLNKTLKEKVPKLVLITPAWSTQVWYPKILNMSIKSPILLPRRKDILKIPKWKI